MSGGRVELGIGAGWYEAEHAAYAIPFPPLGERFERLEEQLTIITGLWATPTAHVTSSHGRYYQVVDSPGLPKPVQRPGPPIIVGGGGTQAHARPGARFAAEFNRAFAPLRELRGPARRGCEAACTAIGRDPATMVYSAALVLCVGRDEAEWRAALRGHRARARRAPRQRRRRPRARGGATLQRWYEAGATRLPAGARPQRPRPPRAGRRRGRPPAPLTPRSCDLTSQFAAMTPKPLLR